MSTGRVGLFVLGLMVSAGCAERPLELDEHGRVTLCLPADGQKWVPLHVALADTAEARETGLSDRQRLPRREGMLFVYPEPQPEDNRFWMYQTPMPLDIAFLDEEGTIRNSFSMRPCVTDDPDSCNHHYAGVEHQAVLEVNKGLLEALGVGEGDQLRLGRVEGQDQCDEPSPFGPSLFERAH